jgi:hypothetical protein
MRAAAIRVAGASALVLCEVGVLRLDLSSPSAPRIVSRIDAAAVGALTDALLLGGRVFLLGERGLQVADARGARVLDSADAAARAGFEPLGRHLLMVGEGSLQVLDTTPFLAALPADAPE